MNSIINSINYLDAIVIILIVLLSIKGFLNGVTRELFGFAGIVGGVFAASRFAGTIASYLKIYFPATNISTLKLIGFMGILLIIWGFMALLGRFLTGSAKEDYISISSRLLGFVLSSVKYFIIFSLIVFALLKTSLIKENIDKTIKSSLLYPYLDKTGAFFINSSGVSKSNIQPKTTLDKKETTERNSTQNAIDIDTANR